MKRAVYADSLFSESGEIYNIALIEADHDRNRYVVISQIGRPPAKLLQKRGMPATFEKARTEYKSLLDRKLAQTAAGRIYLKSLNLAQLDVQLISEAERAALENAVLELHKPPALKPIDVTDPSLVECLEDDMWIGIGFNNNARVLERIGADVFFSQTLLDPSHLFARDAHEIGGEFRFAGYCTGDPGEPDAIFHAFDMIGDGYTSYDFGHRIQLMANYIESANTTHIQVAQFLVGSDKKRQGAGDVGTRFSHLRFMRMDQNVKDGKVRLFPSD